MTVRTATQLKTFFETGDKPTQIQFSDLIDTIFASSNVGAIVNVQAYGAVGNGIADDTAAIQSALTALQAVSTGSGSLYFPSGVYKTSGNHLLTATNIQIMGDDASQSTIYFDQQTATVSCFQKTGTVIDKKNLVFRDIKFKGTADITPSITAGTCRFTNINGYEYVTYINVVGEYSRNMSFSGSYCTNVMALGCKIQYSIRDGFNFTNCKKRQFVSCQFDGLGDDAIACHTNNNAGTPVPSDIIVSGCRFSDTYGIKALGGKNKSITGNAFHRMKGYSVYTTSDTGFLEGFTPCFGLTLTGNTVHDVINASVFGGGSLNSAFFLGSYEPTTGGGAVANIPTMSNTGTGAVVDYIGQMYKVGDGATTVQAGGFANVISGNVVKRTLPAVAQYSDWGYGQTWTVTGFQNPAVTDANMSSISCRFVRSMRNAIVSNNVFSHEGSAISFNHSSTSPDYKFTGITITNNTIYNCCQSGALTNGIVLNEGSTDIFMDVRIFGNNIDVDPMQRSLARASNNGTWATGSFAVPAGINAASAKGISIGGNHYRNCVKYLQPSANTIFYIEAPETLHCQPVATGVSTLNKGLGQCPEANPGVIQYFIEDSDPTSATYRAALGQNVKNSSSIPTAGTYVRGHIVWNTTPTIDANSMVLLGWIRLTTGSAHVAGTDWAIMRTSTVSPAV